MANKTTHYILEQVKYGYWSPKEVEYMLKRNAYYTLDIFGAYDEYTLEGCIRSARQQIRVENLKEPFIYVEPHVGCRPEHLQFQGEMFDKSYFMANVYVSGNPEGIGCFNCRHNFYSTPSPMPPKAPDYDTDDEKWYNQEQRMRYLERCVRKAKQAHDDELTLKYYAKMIEYSEQTGVPIQLNRTWTIDQDLTRLLYKDAVQNPAYEILVTEQVKSRGWYSVAMPKHNIAEVNLLPQYHSTRINGIDLGGKSKASVMYKGGTKRFTLDGHDITKINIVPSTVRDAYTGRPYQAGNPLSKSNIDKVIAEDLKLKIHIGDDLHGWEDKTTTRLLECIGFYMPMYDELIDGTDPHELYEDWYDYKIKKDEVNSNSYGIWSDRDNVFHFYYGELPQSDKVFEVFDFSLSTSPTKINPDILNMPINTASNLKWTRTEPKSKWFTDVFTKKREMTWSNAKYNEVTLMESKPSAETVIKKLVGRDNTNGSCVSQALSYVANINGVDVLDFRGGASQGMFADPWIDLKFLEEQERLGATRLKSKFKTSKANGFDLVNQMEDGVEYFLISGSHCAIVRKTELGLEYLELQKDYGNQWRNAYDRIRNTIKRSYGINNLDDLKKMGRQPKVFKGITQKLLESRFGTDYSNLSHIYDGALRVDTMVINDDFIEMMGYINTDILEQKTDRKLGGEK